MAFATYEIGIDWANNGSFNDFPYDFPITFDDAIGDDDITSDVMKITFTRGRDSELQRATGGNCELTVKNATGKYSPENPGSALVGNLVPGRPVRIRATSGATIDEPLWRGKIDSIIPHPDRRQQNATIRCIDGFDFLSRAEVNTELFAADTTGDLVGELLDDAGWDATLRNLDTGQDTVPLPRWHEKSALSSIQELEASEIGFFYIDDQGRAAFEDRHHRYKAPHTTSQATFDDTMAQLTYEFNARTVFNRTRATFTEYNLQSVSELWRLSETPSIPAGETRTWVAEFSNFSTNLVTPVATTDYTANTESGGGGTDLTGDITLTFTELAQSANLQLANGAAVPAYITLLKVRGDEYTAGDLTARTADNSTSQTAYNVRAKTLDGQFLNDIEQAQDFADFVLARFKDPQPEVKMTISSQTSALLTQLLTRKISDRITVDNDLLVMVNQDFYINKMQHTITPNAQLHSAVYTLAQVDEEEFWTLDISELGTSTKLAY
tara:strand:+ start:431 stop:1918 length:1488 start_codon:yes stop_codon:yes gene_type:complete